MKDPANMTDDELREFMHKYSEAIQLACENGYHQQVICDDRGERATCFYCAKKLQWNERVGEYEEIPV